VIIALAIALFVFAFLAPRRSRGLQRGVDLKLDEGKEAAERSPNAADDLLETPLDLTERAADASADAGRESRSRLR
jgi:hypothetical protein